VLEQASTPAWHHRRVIFVDPRGDLDAQAARRLAALPPATPRDLAPLRVFGYPGWLPQSAGEAFYEDARVFRPPGVK
jgi:hypothetical protein